MNTHKMGTRAFLEADVLASGHSKQETLWLYGGKARRWMPVEQRGCPLEWDTGILFTFHCCLGSGFELA